MALSINSFQGVRVLVVGDVMLDEYIWGEVKRISPEAPVPIVEAQRRSSAPGGAANVATNIASLGGIPSLLGVVGDDESAPKLASTLERNGVKPSGLISDPNRPTTTKTRIIAHSQQVARVDSELRSPLSEEIRKKLLSLLETELSNTNACVFSDYNKGIMGEGFAKVMITRAIEAEIPIIVDPKGSDFSRYLGATVITPNVHEAEMAAGCEIRTERDICSVAEALLADIPGTSLLITRGAQGMSLFGMGQPPIHFPTVARNVYDVTGAGDTVVSALALALASGASLSEAAQVANHAAGIVVGKVGTARVTLDELSEALKDH